MNPCDELRVDLDLAIEARKESRWEVIIRAFLGVIGFEWLYDLIKYQKIDWSVLIDLLVAANFMAAVAWLVSTLRQAGLPGLAGRIAARFGPWALALLAVILIVEIGLAIKKWGELNRVFETEIRTLYQATRCEEKDAVFREKGLEPPR